MYLIELQEHSDNVHELENYRNVLRVLDCSLLKLNPEFKFIFTKS